MSAWLRSPARPSTTAWVSRVPMKAGKLQHQARRCFDHGSGDVGRVEGLRAGCGWMLAEAEQALEREGLECTAVAEAGLADHDRVEPLLVVVLPVQCEHGDAERGAFGDELTARGADDDARARECFDE